MRTPIEILQDLLAQWDKMDGSLITQYQSGRVPKLIQEARGLFASTQYPPIPPNEPIQARRRRLLERIETAQMWVNAYPADKRFQDELVELQEELRVVEGWMGLRDEPKEPEGAQGVMLPTPGVKPPVCDDCGDDNPSFISEGEAAGWWICACGNYFRPWTEEELKARAYCPTCLCLLNHEDPTQSCQCDEDEPDSASDETLFQGSAKSSNPLPIDHPCHQSVAWSKGESGILCPICHLYH